MSNSLQPHGLQHARLPCASLSPRACSNSCPLSHWCHLTISSSVTPFSFGLQSFPASQSFPMSCLFPSDGQSIGASDSDSVLTINIQGTGQEFIESPPNGICLMFFLWLNWSYESWGRKITAIKWRLFFFYHILARVYTINITYCCWCWPWSFSCSGMCQVSLKPLPTPLLLGGSHDHAANGESYTLPPWRQNFCINYLEFFCSGNLSLLPIYLLTYLYQYGCMDVYVIL